MLELDLLLEQFLLYSHHNNLNSEQLSLFGWLLKQPDPLLLSWFTGKEEPEDAAVALLVKLIREVEV